MRMRMYRVYVWTCPCPELVHRYLLFAPGWLSFGDGSAPPEGLEVVMLKLGVPSACEDLYYTDHLHDGTFDPESAPSIPADLLFQGFRGRLDDPFPNRFQKQKAEHQKRKTGAHPAKETRHVGTHMQLEGVAGARRLRDIGPNAAFRLRDLVLGALG